MFQTLYVGPEDDDHANLLSQFESNPFAEEFVCSQNATKGGVYITENILFGW